MSQRATRTLSILVVEDNPVNAILMRELLVRCGHRVHEAASGEAAVVLCGERRFDLAIMDLHMPALGGIEATRRIRAAEKSAGADAIPIFALTADTPETGRKACFEAGMNGFLTKPVDPVELDAVLARIAGRGATAAA